MSEEVGQLSCQELVELVTDYLEDALDDGTRARFELHVGLCHGCAAYLGQMEETATRLGSIPVDSLSTEATSTLLDAFRGFRR
ncbi:MAG TPA: zf-HC2 domain-containing protein [Nocardioides sp.]|uniref:zf-HC2 domain-containing protein n=1 Tax=uncultured Nocardioides sp. TaxID=198441 RepID=UPI002638E1CA|nr:zf-HC2 domain-containing protein [uncultured Nocardioides sp.]HRD59526.1 zf-HC2 domain-containing protein [Nocardioides sp.]HRI95197.1 zf-HC2 domain-containing protein [Nocardioides sp.]HRK45475.1 zf-HC2 domain-containing protein [Nocardioides sp.]